MVNKNESDKADTKTAKAVRILCVFFNRSKSAYTWLKPRLKAAYKWANENLTMGKAIKWGMILLVVVAVIGGYFFG